MKQKILFIFGGKSFENKISIESYKNILSKINKDKYIILSIYIDEIGDWYLLKENNNINNKIKINNKDLPLVDVVFPIIHGAYGEDGKLQGYLEMLNIPYVGCNTLSSSITMDKVFTKELIKNTNILQTEYIYLYEDYDLKDILLKIEEKIKYPCYIKPSNCGSSIGINKVNNSKDVDKYIKEALKYDKKVIIEKEIKGREVEIGIIGNKTLITSCIGEIVSEDYYSYENKYINNDTIYKIPTILSNEIKTNIETMAKKIYKYLECSGLSRVDFFIEEKTNRVYFNEINTMPGFTDISMFPTLFMKSGIKYDILLDKLIYLALNKDK